MSLLDTPGFLELHLVTTPVGAYTKSTLVHACGDLLATENVEPTGFMGRSTLLWNKNSLCRDLIPSNDKRVFLPIDHKSYYSRYARCSFVQFPSPAPSGFAAALLPDRSISNRRADLPGGMAFPALRSAPHRTVYAGTPFSLARSSPAAPTLRGSKRSSIHNSV